MTKSIFKEIYPICTISINKADLKYITTGQIIQKIQQKIQNHPIAEFITVFDNYTHTSNLNGDIMEGLKDAQNVIFCFGPTIPNTKILAVRPRSIGICEFEDKFVFEFLEAPMPELTNLMSSWIKGLSK